MSSHQSRDTKPSDRLSQGPLKVWTEHFNKSHFMKYSREGGPGEPHMHPGGGWGIFVDCNNVFSPPFMTRAILSVLSISKDVLQHWGEIVKCKVSD